VSGEDRPRVAHLFGPPPAGLTADSLPAGVPWVVTLGAPDVAAALDWAVGARNPIVFAAQDGAAFARVMRAGRAAVRIHPALPGEAFSVPSEVRPAARSRPAPTDDILFLFDGSEEPPPLAVSGAGLAVASAAFDGAEWEEALSAAAVFVHTAGHLTPALAEAAARGCAIISVDSPDVAAVFAGGISAVLVPAGDAEALVSAMRQMRPSRVLCQSLGEQARLAAIEHLDSSVVVDDYLELYRDLAGV
jgi:glycosyltransferase involved in cell wall biosynthesis